MFGDFFVNVSNPATIDLIKIAIVETIYMVFTSTAIAYLIGLPTGVLLVVTGKNGLYSVPWINSVLNIMVNILRSVPFLILLIAMSPITRGIVGTTIGTNATIVPLVVSAAPFVARMVEQSLQEVDFGVVEAAQSMGATNMEIICKVLLPEAKSPLMVGGTIALTTILGYSAMAGIVGGGGLGDLAIRFGYYRYQGDTMLVTVILLVILVQIAQEVGMRVARRIDKRNIG